VPKESTSQPNERSADQLLRGSSIASEREPQSERLQRRIDEVTALNDMARAITSMLDPDEILHFIMGEAQELFEAEAASIALIDDDGETLTFRVAVGAGADGVIGQQIQIGQGVAGWVAQTGEPTRVDDTSLDNRFMVDVDKQTGYTTRNIMCAPMIVEDRIIGVVEIINRRTNTFDEDDLRLLSAVSAHVGAAVDRSRLYRSAQRRAEQMTALYEASVDLVGQTHLPDLLEAIASRASDLLNASGGCLYLLEDAPRVEDAAEDRVILRLVAITGPHADHVGLHLRIGEGAAGKAVQTDQPVIVEDYGAWEGRSPKFSLETPTKAVLSIPLRWREHIIGAMGVFDDSEPRRFTDDDAQLLGLIGHLASNAIGNTKLFAETKRRAIDNERLYQEREQAYRDLQEAQNQLVQTEKLRALGQMASGIAHNFNNSLAIILGRTQLTVRRAGSEAIRSDLEAIAQATRDGAATVRRLQEFTRQQPDDSALTILNPNDVVESVAEITRPRWKDQMEAEGRDVELVTETTAIPNVAGNAAELREVLMNLIFNALDAMPQGGTITLRTGYAEGRVTISVEDTGSGIPEEVKNRIFDPFFTTKGLQNSGLGLSTSYGIIARHGGEIHVESEPGIGTTFIISLPPAEERTNQEEEHQAGASAPVSRVMIVDDETELGQIIQRAMEDEGHLAIAFSKSDEALNAFRDQPFDLVITDLGMPALSGWDLAAAIRETDMNVPIVMITGWGDQLDDHLLEKLNIRPVIAKPFEIQGLVYTVTEALRERLQNAAGSE